jgi:GNAT superfamily N-acetyltransferase
MLGHAFFDDPVAAYLLPNEKLRSRRLPKLYRSWLPWLSRHGIVHTDESCRGAAVWQAPSPPRPDRLDELKMGISTLATARSATLRVLAVGRAVMPAHFREPHWYLAILGTEPSCWGQGIGSALMAPVLERCDEERIPAYLESSKESNVAFYERHGFEVTGECQVLGGPKLWPMLRTPR